MLRIKKYDTNDLILTLNEKRLLNTSNFVINFYSNSNKVNNLFFLSGDTSSNPNRWNEYPFNYPILDIGTYDYVVYETTGTTLTISATTGNICESGKAVVIGTGTTIPTLTDNLTEYTFQ
jgi:hypothetical protein